MQTALEFVHEYYRVFSTLDLDRIAEYFSEPCIWVGPQRIFSAANRESLTAAIAPLLAGLKSQGYQRSEFAEPHAETLTESVALVQGIAVRYATANAELERVPLSYLLRRTGSNWKIAVMILSK